MSAVKFLICVALLFAASAVHADPANHKLNKSVAEASCRIVEEASRAHQLPVSVLTRLIWTESRFQPGAVSRAGAQGVAQFMPGTSDERGLKNPFDPEQAIPEAAKLLADLVENLATPVWQSPLTTPGLGEWQAGSMVQEPCLTRPASLCSLLQAVAPMSGQDLDPYIREPRRNLASHCRAFFTITALMALTVTCSRGWSKVATSCQA